MSTFRPPGVLLAVLQLAVIIGCGAPATTTSTQSLTRPETNARPETELVSATNATARPRVVPETPTAVTSPRTQQLTIWDDFELPNPEPLIVGRVVGVTDGDTITVLDADHRQHKIRLEGIDAPESHQAFGTQSKNALSKKIFGKSVSVAWEEKDRYARTLGAVYLDDRWINKEMVEEGWAWHYVEYSDDEDLSSAEQTARAARVGLWVDPRPIAPWDFRHNPGLADAATGSTAAVYVTKTGSKYHRGGCRYLSKSKIPISLERAKQAYGPCSICKPPTDVQNAQQPAKNPTYSSSNNPTPYFSRGPPVAENNDVRGADNDGDGRREPVYVRGYRRKDGTYVRGHYRARPRR